MKGFVFEPVGEVPGVRDADVACAGVDLGSFEQGTSNVVSTSSFIELSTD